MGFFSSICKLTKNYSCNKVSLHNYRYYGFFKREKKGKNIYSSTVFSPKSNKIAVYIPSSSIYIFVKINERK